MLKKITILWHIPTDKDLLQTIGQRVECCSATDINHWYDHFDKQPCFLRMVHFLLLNNEFVATTIVAWLSKQILITTLCSSFNRRSFQEINESKSHLLDYMDESNYGLFYHNIASLSIFSTLCTWPLPNQPASKKPSNILHSYLSNNSLLLKLPWDSITSNIIHPVLSTN